MHNFIFVHVKSEIIIIIIITINFPIGLYLMRLCYNKRQDNLMQYTAIEYNKITHISQNNPQHSRLPSPQKKIRNIYYTLLNSDTIRTYSRWNTITDHWVYKTITKTYYTVLKYTHFTKANNSLHITTFIYNTHPTLPSCPFLHRI